MGNIEEKHKKHRRFCDGAFHWQLQGESNP